MHCKVCFVCAPFLEVAQRISVDSVGWVFPLLTFKRELQRDGVDILCDFMLFKEWFDILGNTLCCRELDEKIDTTLVSVR